MIRMRPCTDLSCLSSALCRGIKILPNHTHVLGWECPSRITRQQQAWLRDGWSQSRTDELVRCLDFGTERKLALLSPSGLPQIQSVWVDAVRHQYTATSYVDAALYLYRVLDLEEVLAENWRWRR